MNDLKASENRLKVLLSAPTTSSAKDQIEETRGKIEGLEAKLTSLRTSTSVLSVEEKTAILNEHDKLFREYR